MKNSSLKVVATLVSTLLLGSVAHAYEQDMNFGTAGFAYAETENSSIPHAMALTNEGRLITVGRSIVDNRSGNFALNITDSEGNNIITTETEITTKRDVAHKVISLANGNILVLGEANAHAAGALYDSEGNFLGSYTSPENHSFFRDAVEQADGKVVVVGYQRFDGVPGFAVIATRFNTDYSVDTSYGDNGVFKDPFHNVDSNYNSVAYAVDMQSDGKVVLGAHVYHLNGTADDFEDYSVLVRLTTDGQIDTTFGTSSASPLLAVTNFVIRDLKINSEDKIFAVGKSTTAARAIKALADGSMLDNTFCGNGISDVETTDGAEGFMAMALENDNAVLATGYASNTTVDLLLANFDSEGNPGHYFGTDTGYLVVDYGATDYGRDLVQNDAGELFVAANIAHDDYTKDITLIKFIASVDDSECTGGHHGFFHMHSCMCHMHTCMMKIHQGLHAFKASASRHHMDYTFNEELNCKTVDTDLDMYEHHTPFIEVILKPVRKFFSFFGW